MAGLTDLRARNIKPGETLPDGTIDGLSLIAGKKPGRGRWEMSFTSPLTRKRRFIGFGSFPEVGVAAARKAGFAAREQIAAGIDPIEERRAEEATTAVAARSIPTFSDMAKVVIEDVEATTRSSKGAKQWERHLGPAYCGPILKRPVNEITTVDVAAVLRPVWHTKPEVARKLHPAIRRVFEHARIVLRDKHGVIFSNPALWADLKAMGFQQPQHLSQGHHASLPYRRMGEFMAALRERDATAARLLELTILTNFRTGTALAATFDQIDLNAGLWIVPHENLKDRKTRREGFRIPLSPRAVEIVREAAKSRVSEFVFPGRGQEPLSNMAMLVLLKRMRSGQEKWLDEEGRPIVVHGFRATFRTWAEECGTFPHSVVEEAMGHVVGGRVECAYRRTDVLEQRRKLMEAWANHCEPHAADNVIPFAKAGGEGGQ